MGVLEIEEGTEESFRSVPVMVRVTMRCERLLCWWMSVAPSALRSMPARTNWMTSPGQWAGLGGAKTQRVIKGCADFTEYVKGLTVHYLHMSVLYRPGGKGGDVILSLRPHRNIVPQLTLHVQERERHASV